MLICKTDAFRLTFGSRILKYENLIKNSSKEVTHFDMFVAVTFIQVCIREGTCGLSLATLVYLSLPKEGCKGGHSLKVFSPERTQHLLLCVLA